MSRYENYKYLQVEVNEGIALITINRLEYNNGYDYAGHYEMTQIWNDIDHDPDVRVAVITGAGTKSFCDPRPVKGEEAGPLKHWFAMKKADFFKVTAHRNEGPAIFYGIINAEKPIIAAVNGDASGSGLAIAVLSDISVVSETAELVDVHMGLGMAAGDNIAFWPIMCGLAKAKLIALTGGTIDGKEAERIGLVGRSVPQAQVLPVAMEYARTIAKGPQYAVRFTKRAMNQWLKLAGITAFDLSYALEQLTFYDVDMEEGYYAAIKGEEPQFPSVKTAGPKHT
ncbi:MAG: enoyl-CoA hydratase-related protein [Dehalococcoidia bacterium]|nr:enoyl-CoA hydratase-related protein [Dehalococcoidia bacterium]